MTSAPIRRLVDRVAAVLVVCGACVAACSSGLPAGASDPNCAKACGGGEICCPAGEFNCHGEAVCCLGGGQACSADAQCCYGTCSGGRCGCGPTLSSAGAADRSPCAADADCCSGSCSDTTPGLPGRFCH